CVAGSTDRHFGSADHRVYKAVAMKSPAMGLRVLVVACVWIMFGLVVADPALGAPQFRDSEKKQDSEKRDSEKQEAEKTTSGDAGTAGKRADGKTRTAHDSGAVDSESLGTPHLRLADLGRDFVLDQKQ